MQAKVLVPMPFLGVMRKAGDVLSEDEMSRITITTRDALVGQGLIELAAFPGKEPAGAPAAAMSPADQEAIQHLAAAFEKFREDTNARLDAISKAMGVKTPKKARKE